MYVISKQILAPGDYMTGQGPVTFTPDDLKSMADQGKRMLSLGLSVPAPLEHQENTEPVDEATALANTVLHNAGWVKNYQLAGDGSLWADIEVHHPTLTKEDLQNRVRYVSPQIHPVWRDGAGREWKKVITHIALTPQPVWGGQLPFGAEMPVLMSLVTGVSHQGRSLDAMMAPLRLSLLDAWRFGWQRDQNYKGRTAKWVSDEGLRPRYQMNEPGKGRGGKAQAQAQAPANGKTAAPAAKPATAAKPQAKAPGKATQPGRGKFVHDPSLPGVSKFRAPREGEGEAAPPPAVAQPRPAKPKAQAAPQQPVSGPAQQPQAAPEPTEGAYAAMGEQLGGDARGLLDKHADRGAAPLTPALKAVSTRRLNAIKKEVGGDKKAIMAKVGQAILADGAALAKTKGMKAAERLKNRLRGYGHMLNQMGVSWAQTAQSAAPAVAEDDNGGGGVDPKGNPPGGSVVEGGASGEGTPEAAPQAAPAVPAPEAAPAEQPQAPPKLPPNSAPATKPVSRLDKLRQTKQAKGEAAKVAPQQPQSAGDAKASLMDAVKAYNQSPDDEGVKAALRSAQKAYWKSLPEEQKQAIRDKHEADAQGNFEASEEEMKDFKAGGYQQRRAARGQESQEPAKQEPHPWASHESTGTAWDELVGKAQEGTFGEQDVDRIVGKLRTDAGRNQKVWDALREKVSGPNSKISNDEVATRLTQKLRQAAQKGSRRQESRKLVGEQTGDLQDRMKTNAGYGKMRARMLRQEPVGEIAPGAREKAKAQESASGEPQTPSSARMHRSATKMVERAMGGKGKWKSDSRDKPVWSVAEAGDFAEAQKTADRLNKDYGLGIAVEGPKAAAKPDVEKGARKRMLTGNLRKQLQPSKGNVKPLERGRKPQAAPKAVAKPVETKPVVTTPKPDRKEERVAQEAERRDTGYEVRDVFDAARDGKVSKEDSDAMFDGLLESHKSRPNFIRGMAQALGIKVPGGLGQPPEKIVEAMKAQTDARRAEGAKERGEGIDAPASVGNEDLEGVARKWGANKVASAMQNRKAASSPARKRAVSSLTSGLRKNAPKATGKEKRRGRGMRMSLSDQMYRSYFDELPQETLPPVDALDEPWLFGGARAPKGGLWVPGSELAKAKKDPKQKMAVAKLDNPFVEPAVWADRDVIRYSLRGDMAKAARETDKTPTDAQRESGNYKMGHVRIHGLDVTIEIPRGGIRSKVGSDGKRWRRKMKCHYGYIKKSKAKDGDHVDVYIGDRPESEIVFVVNQKNKKGEFDEHKCMIGFDNEEDARKAYLKHYPANWTGLGSVCAMTTEQFKEWIESGSTTKPA